MRCLPVLFAAFAAAAAEPAAEAAEDELVLGVEPAYAYLSGPPEGLHGGGGDVTLSYGLTDSIWLSASAGASRQAKHGMRPALTLFEAFGGVTVALDVLRTIPFVEALIGVVLGDPSGDAASALSPTIRIGVGADYLLTRSVSLGGVVRWRPVTDALGGSEVSAHLRLGLRFEL
jgi:hypothetical protein